MVVVGVTLGRSKSSSLAFAGSSSLGGARAARGNAAGHFALAARSSRRGPTLAAAAMKGEEGSEQGPQTSIETRLVHLTNKLDDPFDSVAPPLYQTATFNQPGATGKLKKKKREKERERVESKVLALSCAPRPCCALTLPLPSLPDFGAYDYSRSGNPTRTLLENQMADVENADRAFAFASGMAAIATVMRLVKPGEAVLAGNDIYGGTQRFLGKISPTKQGQVVKHVDMTRLQDVEKVLVEEGGNIKLVLVESPTNPR